MKAEIREYIKEGLKPSFDARRLNFEEKTSRNMKYGLVLGTATVAIVSVVLVNKANPQTAVIQGRDIILINDLDNNLDTLTDRLYDNVLVGPTITLNEEEFHETYPMFQYRNSILGKPSLKYSPETGNALVFYTDLVKHQSVFLILSHESYENQSCTTWIDFENMSHHKISLIEGIPVYIYAYHGTVSYAYFEYQGLYVSIEVNDMSIDEFTLFIKDFTH